MAKKLEDIELRSEEVQEILTKVPHWMIRWGNVLFLLLIFVLLLISWFIQYPDIISSEAVITTQIPPQKVYAKLTREIDTVLVANNDRVEAGQPLAILENTGNYNDIYYLKSIVDTTRLTASSFYFPLDSLSALFLGDIEDEFAIFENSYWQYKLNKELRPFSNETRASKLTISELNNRMLGLETQKELSLSELEFTKNDLARNELLHEKGVIATTVFENKQIEYLRAERAVKNMNVAISQLREAINNANAASRGVTIDQAREEVRLRKNLIQSLTQLKTSIKDWEMQYVLSSNRSGKVSFLKIWTKNQSVNMGDLIFTIIPSANSNYVAKLKTPTQNSGKIKLGQRVHIKLENYPETEFGVLKGMVQNISSIPNEEGLYLLDAVLPQRLITSYQKELEFKHEMRGKAEIITEDLRLIERFFYQFKDIFVR
ncbi:MAG: HlyD family efflux transporter periplasmic adaptor subunit [Bacteroidota bacterium]